MKFGDYCYGPLSDVLDSLQGDYPPEDPQVLRAVLTRCVAEIISLRAELARVGAAQPLTEAQQAQEANLRG